MRHYKDWIDACTDAVPGKTVPLLFRRWVPLAAIGAAMGRAVWYNHGDWSCPANLYIVLVGPPASGKTTALTLPIDLVFDKLTEPLAASIKDREAAQLTWQKYMPDEWSLPRHVINGRITYEKLCRNLSRVQRRIERTTDGRMEASLLIRTGEFGAFMSKFDKDLHMLLTDGWDAGKNYTYDTKNAGTDYVQGPCLTWIACATPTEFIAHMPPNAGDQGLLSRVIPVVYTGAQIAPERKTDDFNGETVEKLAEDLGQIAQITGEFKFDKAAAELIDKWLEEGSKPLPTEATMNDYNGRRLSHLFKMSMCFSAARDDKRVIEAQDWLNAQDLLFETEKYMPFLLRRFGMSEAGKLADGLVDFVKVSGGRVGKKAMRREAMRRAKSISDIEKTLDLLVESGTLELQDDLYKSKT